MLSYAGMFIIGFGTAWAVGLVVTSDGHRRRGGQLADSDLLISLLTPALIMAAGVGLYLWG